MNITAIYGSEKMGSTYHIARMFIENIKTEADSLTEFFLPRDMDKFCVGCANCFAKGEQACPHFEQVEPIRLAIENAGLVIFTTPVYALRVSGQMKALLDHLSFQFMIHRPNAKMFGKTALVIATGAGGGMNPAIRDITISLRFWGIAKTFTFGQAVYAADWSDVSYAKKRKITRRVSALAARVRARVGFAEPDVFTKLLFYVHRHYQGGRSAREYDANYWHENGWLDKQRPWR